MRESTYIKYDTVLEKHIKPKLGGCFPLGITTGVVDDFIFHFHLLLSKYLARAFLSSSCSCFNNSYKFGDFSKIFSARRSLSRTGFICLLIAFRHSLFWLSSSGDFGRRIRLLSVLRSRSKSDNCALLSSMLVCKSATV
ncbi:hypothetical protein [Merdimmobilis hominis]|uniref:hypothetical protein n=1 Tax=Merdimmobilis hominis TaxID=2897707 RepID=UPI003D2FA264